MNRNSTSFPSEVTEKLWQYLSSIGENELKYYQLLCAEYMKYDATKGLFLFHSMGSGKTVNAYNIAFELMTRDPKMKMLVISPATLVDNFVNAKAKFEEITGHTFDSSRFAIVRSTSTVEKQIAQTDPDAEIDPFNYEKKADKILNMENLNGYIVIIEESHMFTRKIVHGSETMYRLYKLLMESACRILMMSGSLVASSVFEVCVIGNLLSGVKILPESEEEFEKVYMEDGKIKSGEAALSLQMRLVGLISRIKESYFTSEDKAKFPKYLGEEVIRIPMGEKQLTKYMTARNEEVQLEKQRKKSVKRNNNASGFRPKENISGSFRVRSRQMSNAVTDDALDKLYLSKEYDQEMLIKAVWNMSLEDLMVEKVKKLIEIIEKHPKEKILVYTQFVGFGGAANIAAALYKYGMDEVDSTGKVIKRSGYERKVKPELGRFALINGSMDKIDQTRIIDLSSKESNDHGDDIHVKIIGFEQTMGLDLNTERITVMFEPYWVKFIRDQFVARAVRYGSHLRLNKNEQNVKSYIFLSTYPKSVNVNDLDFELRLTTDEYVYKKMVENGEAIKSLIDIIEPVAIECELVKKFSESKHECRTCMPTDQPLFTPGNLKDNPMTAIQNDIEIGSNCKSGEKQEVKAKEITIVIDGQKTTYYYIPTDKNIYGFLVYFEVSPDTFEQVPTNSPVFKEIIKNIKKK